MRDAQIGDQRSRAGTLANNRLPEITRGRASRWRGFTLVELTLTAAVLAVVLATLSQGIGHVRNQGMAQFTRDVLAQTSGALADYHRRTGLFPPDRFAPGWLTPTASHLPPTEGIECLVATLSSVSGDARPFWKMPRLARAFANTDGDSSASDNRPLYEIVDGWGRPLLYYHGYGAKPVPGQPGLPVPDAPGMSSRQMARLNESLAERWALNGQRPLLDSAGPDGLFGNSDDIRPAHDLPAGESNERS